VTAEGAEQIERGDAWSAALAGAFAGVAGAAFTVSLLTHIYQTRGIYVGNYEPLAAFIGALGVWLASPGRSMRHGVLGLLAALFAMLLGDLFRILALSLVQDMARAPLELLATFRLRLWPRLLRCLFGLYIGWHLGFGGRAGAPSEPATNEEPH
jgi:uncharacterized membrane protein